LDAPTPEGRERDHVLSLQRKAAALPPDEAVLSSGPMIGSSNHPSQAARPRQHALATIWLH
jgi:hypothetical protein